MSDLTVRDVDSGVVERMDKMARATGQTVEELARYVLTRTFAGHTDRTVMADLIRAMNGPQTTDSTELIREFRDSR